MTDKADRTESLRASHDKQTAELKSMIERAGKEWKEEKKALENEYKNMLSDNSQQLQVSICLIYIFFLALIFIVIILVYV